MDSKLWYQAAALFAIILAGSYLLYQPDKNEMAIQMGKTYVTELQSALGKTLKQTITEKGVPAAVEVCNIEAPKIRDEITIGMNDNITVRRFSDKPRNRNNEAGPYEQAAIEHFRSSSDLKDNYLQQVSSNDTTVMYQYYEPIYTKGLCLNCHGAKNEMNPTVVAKIDSLYPTDRAKGYTEGELRGVFKVLIPASEVKEPN